MGSPVFLIWIVLIGAMFYFMMIRPQKRARQQQVDMLQHLQPGAQVRTTAQIMGTVVEVGDDWAIVETTPGTRIKFGKPAIVGIILDDDAAEAADAEGTDAVDGADAPTPGGIGDAPPSRVDQTPVNQAGADETGADQSEHDKTQAQNQAQTQAQTQAGAGAGTDAAAAEPAEDAEPVAKP